MRKFSRHCTNFSKLSLKEPLNLHVKGLNGTPYGYLIGEGTGTDIAELLPSLRSRQWLEPTFSPLPNLYVH